MIDEPVVLGVPQVWSASGCGLERGCASWELQAFEDLPRHRRILDGCDEPQRGPAARAPQSVDLEDILYNGGISIEGDLLDLGVECGIVEKSGAWLSFEAERIGQGRENARRLLLENPDVRGRLADAVRFLLGQGGPFVIC